MRKIDYFIMILVCSIAISAVSATTYINSLPYTISGSGEYVVNITCTNLSTNAITINADNVVLDGNWKLLDGYGGDTSAYLAAVYSNGHKNITIMHIRATGWNYQIYLNNSLNCKVIDNSLDVTNWGIFLENTNNSLIKNNYVCNATKNYEYGAFGIYVKDSSDVVIDSNVVNNNWGGIALWHANNCNIINNIAKYNDGGGICLYSSRYNLVQDNTANYNGLEGIYLGKAHPDRIGCWYNTVKYNNFNYNGKYGLWMEYSRGNYIYLNNFIDNSQKSVNIDRYSDYYYPSYYYYYYYPNNKFSSPTMLSYYYHNYNCSNYSNMGNYYSDNDGLDENHDGIIDESYQIGTYTKDSHSLANPIENYDIFE